MEKVAQSRPMNDEFEDINSHRHGKEQPGKKMHRDVFYTFMLPPC